MREWYAHGYNRADTVIPRMQVDTNLKVVATMPRWKELKGPKNGYVMLETNWMFGGSGLPGGGGEWITGYYRTTSPKICFLFVRTCLEGNPRKGHR